ncbi:MAG: efflux RND transporter permease subunit, partial [Myxococcales bacterium]|nr:efflux RND transporter permease subunit [Myxococcales bacterium]
VTQIVNFGLPSPVDVQISGPKVDESYAIAKAIEKDLRASPGAVDVRLHQITTAPRLHVDVDRIRSADVGLTERDVAQNLLLVVSTSSQVSPTYWTDPTSGNAYPVAIGVPEYRVTSTDELGALAFASARGIQTLGDLATITRKTTPVFVSHSNVQPTFDVRADVAHADLGLLAKNVDAVVAKHSKSLPPGTTITVRGQAESMTDGFRSLALGLGLASILVYGLMVVNFQSWKHPFIILMALPGAGVGLVLALFATGTTFSIPSLMGAITSVGIATANSILVVTFAKEQRELGLSPREAALEAGSVRLRPVMMTAIAMAVGMLPMSLGHGEGGEQNAALGRAVLGGLVGATLATLLFVPVVYSVLAKNDAPRAVDPELEDPAPRPRGHIPALPEPAE